MSKVAGISISTEFANYPEHIQRWARDEYRRRNAACRKLGSTAREMGITIEQIAFEFAQDPELAIPAPAWTRESIREGIYTQRFTQYDSPALLPGQSPRQKETY